MRNIADVNKVFKMQLIFVLFCIYFPAALAFFDVDEINTIDYGIDILDKPVVINEVIVVPPTCLLYVMALYLLKANPSPQ